MLTKLASQIWRSWLNTLAADLALARNGVSSPRVHSTNKTALPPPAMMVSVKFPMIFSVRTRWTTMAQLA
eukprot:1641932-Pyramimonas_sp.AAC.1